MAINRYYSAIAQDTALTTAASNSATSLVVNATTGFPTSYPFVLAVDFGASSEELVSVTNVAGLTLTVTRGFNGTTAVSHTVGAVVRHVIVAQDMTEMQAHLASTTGAHGVTGAVVGTTDTQTLTNKTLTAPVISTITNTGTITLPTSTDTLVGRATTDTLTNKTLTTPTITSPVATVALNAQTGTTYTFVLGDASKFVTCSNASAIAVSIPTNASVAFPTGTIINVQQIGAGQVTIAAASSGTTTVTSAGATSASPKIRVQYSAVTCIKTGTDTWTVVGDLV